MLLLGYKQNVLQSSGLYEKRVERITREPGPPRVSSVVQVTQHR